MYLFNAYEFDSFSGLLPKMGLTYSRYFFLHMRTALEPEVQCHFREEILRPTLPG